MRNRVNKLIQNNPIVQFKVPSSSLDLFDESAVLSRHLPRCVRHGSVEPDADDQHVQPDHQETEDDEEDQKIKVGVVRKLVLIIVFMNFSVCFPFQN